MNIAFVTTQNLEGSTVIGRVLPLARELAKNHTIHVLLHHPVNRSQMQNINFHAVGKNPFTKTSSGKKRQKGVALVWQMAGNTAKTFYTLFKCRPDRVVIVKPLPQNVLAVRLWSLLNPKAAIILDVDDFELTANLLSSMIQRSAIHWSERVGARVSRSIVAASPFLKDHFEQLVNYTKEVHMIQTGLSHDLSPVKDNTPSRLLYIGSLSESSGHRVGLLPDILKRVTNEIPGIKMHIAGGGEDSKSLKKAFAANNLSDSVIWHGRFQADKTVDFLSTKTVIIDPVDASINNRAKSSFRVALACAAGLPVVTSDIGIRPYLLPDTLHNRFFAAPENPADYAQKIIALLRSPLPLEDATAMKIHSKKNTWHFLAKHYENIITD